MQHGSKQYLNTHHNTLPYCKFSLSPAASVRCRRRLTPTAPIFAAALLISRAVWPPAAHHCSCAAAPMRPASYTAGTSNGHISTHDNITSVTKACTRVIAVAANCAGQPVRQLLLFLFHVRGAHRLHSRPHAAAKKHTRITSCSDSNSRSPKVQQAVSATADLAQRNALCSRDFSSSSSLLMTRCSAAPSGALRLPLNSCWLRSLNVLRRNAAKDASCILQTADSILVRSAHGACLRLLWVVDVAAQLHDTMQDALLHAAL